MIDWRKIAGGAVVLAALSLSGCNGAYVPAVAGDEALKACANIKTADNKNVTDAQGNPHSDLLNFLIEGLAVNPSDVEKATANGENPFDKFLDCYVGPVDASDIEQRLLRGYVVVTMPTMYGDYNVRLRPYADMVDNARTILHSAATASLRLSLSSNVVYHAAGNAGTIPTTPLPTFERVERVVDVLQLAIDVERPTVARAREGVFNLTAAIGGSPTALRDLIGEALTGIKKATVLAVYGTAIRNDAYTFLARIKARKTVTIHDWEVWDRYMYGACAKLAGMTGSVNRCVPSAATIREYFSGRTGPASRTATP